MDLTMFGCLSVLMIGAAVGGLIGGLKGFLIGFLIPFSIIVMIATIGIISLRNKPAVKPRNKQ